MRPSVVLCLLFLCTSAVRSEETSPVERGRFLYFQGKTLEARAEYEKAVEQSTGTAQAEALKDLAVVQRDLGDLAHAVLSLKKAAELEPNDRRLEEQKAWFTYLSGDPKLARKEAQALKGSTLLSRFTEAVSNLELGKLRKAAEALETLVQDAPGFLPGEWELGEARERQKDWKKARAAYEKGLQTDFTYSELRLALARVAARQKKDADVRRQLLEVRKVDSKNPAVLERAAELEVIASSATAESAAEFASSAAKRRLTANLPLAPGRDLSPRIRVGLGTTPSGKPSKSYGVLFMAGGPFKVSSRDSGALLARGGPNEAWAVEVSTATGGWVLRPKAPEGSAVGGTEPLVIETLCATHTVLLHNVRTGAGFAWSRGLDREYRGRIELIPDSTAGFILVDDISLPEYLYSVLPSEMPGLSPLEALKAQAVVTRTNALRRRGEDSPHRGLPYDVCDGQHCQVYSGVRTENGRGRKAVDETYSLVMRQAGHLAAGLFHANCGGHTQSAADNDGWAPDSTLVGKADGPEPWPRSPWDLELGLKSRTSGAFCAGSRQVAALSHRWAWVVPASDLAERVKRRKDIGALRQVLPLGRAPSGYLRGVRFVGEGRELDVLREHEIRRVMAVGQVRSALFLIDPQYDGKGRLERVFVFGGGWGHGVGLCQGGAVDLAAVQHKGFLEILFQYFTGVSVERWESSAQSSR